MMPHTLTEIAFDQIPELQGRTFHGEWFAVGEDRLAPFEFASYVAENEAAFGQDLYPAGLVEGFHLVSLLDHLCNEILRTDPRSCTGWNYGLDRVRFVTPVTVADRIRLHLTVAETRPKDDGYVLTFDCVIEHSGSERPAFMARWLVYWLPVG